MRRAVALVGLLILAVAGAGAYYWQHRGDGEARLVLQGNVDVREVDLAFKVGGRISELAVDEGDRVGAGQVLASLDKRYFDDALDQARAREAAQQAALDKLRDGSRPEEIAEAKAEVDAARAASQIARITLAREKLLLTSSVASQQSYDSALADSSGADARLDGAGQALALAIAGARPEDIAAARAQLDAAQDDVTSAERNLQDADLMAPEAGTVLTRSREPGAIVGPGEDVFTLALDAPVWVRAYVAEPQLGLVRPGMEATIATDMPGGRQYHGKVGFISPVAEFTPKTVETQELRTDLVYRLRIVVDDADRALLQGMPVTVSFAPAGG